MTEPPTPKPDSGDEAGERSAKPAVRSIASETLLAGEREILIHHDSHIYRLRVTASNKLILMK
jgi:hemin uptake protein HemP